MHDSVEKWKKEERKKNMVVFKLVVAMKRKWIFQSGEKKEVKC